MKITKESLIFIFILTLFGFIVLPSFVKAVPPKLNPSDYDTGITWAQAVKLKKPIVANFYVNWCHYCQRFAPTLDNLRREYKSKYTFVLIKADNPQNQKLVDDFGISGYPSLYLVNPKNDNRVFINQSFYSNPRLLKREFDRFLKVNKVK